MWEDSLDAAPSAREIDPEFYPHVLQRAVDGLADVVECRGLPRRMRKRAMAAARELQAALNRLL